MKIEYIYHTNENPKDITEELRKIERANTIGCLITGLVMLCMLFAFLYLLPFILIVLGFIIIGVGLLTIYKVYLERHVLNFIQKHNLRRK